MQGQGEAERISLSLTRFLRLPYSDVHMSHMSSIVK